MTARESSGSPSGRKFCPDCGKKMEIDDKFCPNCGKPQRVRTTSEAEDVCFACGKKASFVTRFMRCDVCSHHYCGEHIPKSKHRCLDASPSVRPPPDASSFVLAPPVVRLGAIPDPAKTQKAVADSSTEKKGEEERVKVSTRAGIFLTQDKWPVKVELTSKRVGFIHANVEHSMTIKPEFIDDSFFMRLVADVEQLVKGADIQKAKKWNYLDKVSVNWKEEQFSLKGSRALDEVGAVIRGLSRQEAEIYSSETKSEIRTLMTRILSDHGALLNKKLAQNDDRIHPERVLPEDRLEGTRLSPEGLSLSASRIISNTIMNLIIEPCPAGNSFDISFSIKAGRETLYSRIVRHDELANLHKVILELGEAIQEQARTVAWSAYEEK